ncbi:hypothetical protein BsWGS_07790 [Bradybaena similaris]
MMAVDDMRPVYSHRSMEFIKQELPTSETRSKTIHSGHFMVSRVHDANNDDDEEEPTSPFSDDSKGFDFFTASKETSTTYNFSHTDNQAVGIDASLTKLFECMTLAYSGKITSPKWKQFRGLHLSQKQRIRLNNLIWREWHMQYIYGKNPMVCQFATPLSDHIHSKPEAVVLEGKYWKRQLDTVTAEYKKWRRYFKERVRNQHYFSLQENMALSEWELLERVKDVTFIPHSSGSYVSSTDLNLLQTDITDMDFTSELFASLNQPFAFPNPRELSQLGYADFIQPGLIQLQPNLEEFMDIDTMQELFGTRMPSAFSSAFAAESSPPAAETSLGGIQTSDMSLENFLRGSSAAVSNANIIPSEVTSSPVSASLGDDNTTVSFLNNGGEPTHNITLQLTSDGRYHLDTSAILLGNTLPQGSPQSFTLVPSGLYGHTSNQPNMHIGSAQKPVVPTSVYSASELLNHLFEQQLHQPVDAMLTPRKNSPQQSPVPIQPAPSLNQHQRQQVFQPCPSPQNPALTQALSFQHHHQHHQPHQPHVAQTTNHSQTPSKGLHKMHRHSPDSSIRASTISSGSHKEIASSSRRKKDGPFIVPAAPVVKPAIVPRKPHMIAPAPPVVIPPQQTTSSSSSSQASYLAELLKNGTYAGALINVKKEPILPSAVSSPIKTTTNFYQHMVPSFNPAFDQRSGSSMATITASSPTAHLSHAVASSVGGTSNLDSMAPSSGLGSYEPCLPILKESSVRYFHGMEPKTSPSSISILPKSPRTSPPLAKRTPSPTSSVEMGIFGDPVSPFSSSMQLSPSVLGLDSAPDSPGSGDSLFPKENRRTAHLSAEQKRRCNLKTGFDMLQQLVPSLTQNPKVSKATMLQKTAEYCKKLKAERTQMQKESAILKQEIDSLNSAISMVQSQLPETGVPVTRQRKDMMKEIFDEYVQLRTVENSKFWIFSMLMNSLYESYCNTVSTSSLEEMCRTTLTWLDRSCSLVTLRPNVLNALRKLSTSTPILTEPQRMKEHALQAVSRKGK